MTTLAVTVFILTYVGMALGRVPGLAVDRTGVALLGLIVLLASGDLTLEEAGAAVDMPTIALLFALMILSAQFEHSGFYGWVANRIVRAARSPKILLGVLIAVTGRARGDLHQRCRRLRADAAGRRRPDVAEARPAALPDRSRRRRQRGFGRDAHRQSAEHLIGQAGGLDFWSYFVLALPPTLAALVITFVAVLATWRLAPAADASLRPTPPRRPPIDRFQMAKGLAAVALLVGLFLTPLPRELSALAVAGLLLMSRRLSSRAMIGAVDWHLLLLFACLFGVTAAFAKTGLSQDGLAWLAAQGLLPDSLSVLAPLTLAASNTIGNVPAVILIIQLVPDLSDGTLAALALLSTFAGNLLLTGSLCNIIVAERAANAGTPLSFADFARSGIPMTLASLAVTVAWLWATGLVGF